ncbi:unnamed protein product [Thlaspi arvense]|uniref:Uncharacterized protein n=1 Tax=Thlaspi arvense TaxID=13288 RepID=A0AAU9RT78_THLAR|nr:unnamed protein product [Thlaspi arvense]
MHSLEAYLEAFATLPPSKYWNHATLPPPNIATMPQCLGNFSAMAKKEGSIGTIFCVYSYMHVENVDFEATYMANGSITWKGRLADFGKNLGLLKVIDLSSNNLSGRISTQMTSLFGLVALNLSRNHLTGTIPTTEGDTSQRQALDFSRNKLSGKIPSTLVNLNFLQFLDLSKSNNNLFGKVPSSTQLESFNAFSNDPMLCGPLLGDKCQGDEPP